MIIMKEPLDLLISEVSKMHRDIVNKIVDVMDIQTEHSKTDEENKAYDEVISLLRKRSGEVNVEESKLIIRKSQLESLSHETKNSKSF